MRAVRGATRRLAAIVAVVAGVGSLLVAGAAPASASTFPGAVSTLYDLPGSPWAPGSPVVALTIDDGPSSSITPGTLDVLRDRGVPATFFVVGSYAAQRPDLVRRAAAEGHVVEPHTWTHPRMTQMPDSAWAGEVDQPTRYVAELTGRVPSFFRPPYGAIDGRVVDGLRARGLTPVLWDVDPGDTRGYGADRIAANAVAAAHPGAIIVVHDGSGHGPTLAALPAIIDGIRAKGLRFVTLPPGRLVRTGTRLLRDTATSGVADRQLVFGGDGDVQLACDWTGSGVDAPVLFRRGTWYLRRTNDSGIADASFGFGDPGDVPVCGDWDGDGVDTPGVFRNGRWYLTDDAAGGFATSVVGFGDPGDEPIVGRWAPTGPHPPDSIGVHRGNRFLLGSNLRAGVADIVFAFGDPGDRAVVGDWAGAGRDGIGVFRSGAWFLRTTAADGPPDLALSYGLATDDAIAGDWDGDGRASPGVCR